MHLMSVSDQPPVFERIRMFHAADRKTWRWQFRQRDGCKAANASRRSIASALFAASTTVLSVALASLCFQVAAATPAPENAEVYFIWPADGTVIKGGKFWVRMGLRNMGIAPKGVVQPTCRRWRSQSRPTGIICISARVKRKPVSSCRPVSIRCKCCSATTTTDRISRPCIRKKFRSSFADPRNRAARNS